MKFDFSDLNTKIAKVMAAAPAMSQMIQAAEVVMPGVAGLAKADFVIQTLVAIEPVLVGCEQVMATAITGIVTAYRAAGTLPPKAPAAPGAQ